jgi:hypothetical protein
MINLTNTSQATEDLGLGDYKSASPGRNKVSFLTEPFGVNQRQNIFPCSSVYAAREL